MHAGIDALMRPRFWSLLPSTILDWVIIIVSVSPSVDTTKHADTSRECYLEYFARRLHRTDLLLVGAREHCSGCTSLHLQKCITTGVTHHPPTWHTSHICHVRTPTPPRPAPPPHYSPPSPIYHPDPTPSPARTNIPSCQTASPTPDGNSPGNCSGGSTNVNTGQKTPETTVFKRHSDLIPRKASNNGLGATKLWQQIQIELSKEPFKFC